MSDDDDSSTPPASPRAPIPFAPPRRRRRPGSGDSGGSPRRPRLKKLRLLWVVTGLGAIAAASLVFGMMMAVASDLPQLENKQQYGREVNSYLYDDQGRPIGIFAPPDHDVIDTYGGLGHNMRQAIVSVEDKNFWHEPGIDLRSTARALVADVTGSARQGASTIAQQFVKNALAEEGHRTVFEKLREATLAFRLTHEWRKTKILTEYLNAIYFGNGAYGVESAARTYFGRSLGYDPEDLSASRCGAGTAAHPEPTCAQRMNPAQAALLAGMVANPTGFDPVYDRSAAKRRRDLVLQDMWHQGDITHAGYEHWRDWPLPNASDIQQPAEPAAAPYFTSWLAPQVLSAIGLGHGVSAKVAEFKAYYGGLKIHTTIDLAMQQAAQRAISEQLPTGSDEPTASLVSIDNRTGQVRAMVGGPLVDGQADYSRYPFNLATQGLRQPGSAFKPFTLAVALEHGYGPDSVFDSKPVDFREPKVCGQANYRPRNFDNEYLGPIPLTEATAQSDNSVFTQLGLSPNVGTRRVAAMARAAGIQSPISQNCAMIIGGLKIGVSPLEMAQAYETFADGGRRVYDPVLGSPGRGPIGIASIDCPIARCRGRRRLVSRPDYRRVMPAPVAAAVHELLAGVVTSGTGQAAAIPGVDVVGKTGTTENEGDAWFVGWTPQFTTAVWVGFPNKLIPMLTQFRGGPVTGGTYPAEIWKAYTEAALQISAAEAAAHASRAGTSTTATAPAATLTGAGTATAPTQPAPAATTPAPSATATSSASAPTTPGGGTGATGSPGGTGGTGAGGTGAAGGATGGSGAAGGGTAGGGTGAAGGGTSAGGSGSTAGTGGGGLGG
jgi:penicillin-binding protein 1A